MREHQNLRRPLKILELQRPLRVEEVDDGGNAPYVTLGREERGERKGLRVVMMRALVEEFDGARDAEVC